MRPPRIVDAPAQIDLYDDVGAVFGEQLLDELLPFSPSGTAHEGQALGERAGEAGKATLAQVQQCPLVYDTGIDCFLQRAVAEVLLFQSALVLLQQCGHLFTVLLAALYRVLCVVGLLFGEVAPVGVNVVGGHIAYVGAGHVVIGKAAQGIEVDDGLHGAHGHGTFECHVDVVAISYV